MFKNVKMFLFIVCLSVLLLPKCVQAKTIDNDGKERSVPYGDSGLPNSFKDADYYDCYVPYQLTLEDIGGYSDGVIATAYEAYNFNMKDSYPDLLGKSVFSYYANYYTTVGYAPAGGTLGSDGSIQTVKDARGNEYYMTAIQQFYYDFPGLDTSKGFPAWSQNRGQLFDVILTNGNVLHFAVCDNNDSAHTNGGPMETSLWNVQWHFSPVKLSQYTHIYSAGSGNSLEIAGYDGSAGGQMQEKYGMSADGGRIAYYRMYNRTLADAPERTAEAGKGPSSSLGELTVSASGSKSESKDRNGVSQIVSEWELEGMPDRRQLTKDQKELSFLSKNSLTVEENVAVASVKENLELAKEWAFVDKVRVSFVFIGLLLVMYSLLLFLAMIFDRVNNFIEISLVSVLTLGALHYVKDDTDYHKRRGYANTGKLVCSIIIIAVIGFLLISGSLMSMLGDLLYSIIVKFM